MAYKYQKEVLIMQYGRVCSLCKRKLKKKFAASSRRFAIAARSSKIGALARR